MERVVTLSDLHLGEEESTLKGNTVIELKDELEEIGEIDQLILLGDVLDLSMSSFPKAVEMAKLFFKEIGEFDGINEIVYVPGNHDHHLWIQHIEYHDVIIKMQNGEIPQNPDYIKEFRSSDSFLSSLLSNNAKHKLTVKYPNHVAQVQDKRCFFHHGHHLSKEGTLLMTLREALKDKANLNDFELHNSAIHELIQYSLVQSDKMRKRIEEAWEKGGTLAAILSVIDEMTDRKGFIGKIIGLSYKWSMRKKMKPNAMRGYAIDKRIIGDMEKYMKLSEVSNSHWFVYGHTHVPEGKRREGSFSIVNAGSWLKSSERLYNTYVVIDEDVVIRRLGDTAPYWS